LGIEINEGTSTGLNHFSNGAILESYSPVTGQLIAKVQPADYEKYWNLQLQLSKLLEQCQHTTGEIVRQFGEKLRKNRR
jgi:aldehyde dehydrogenase (NAD+)